METWPVPSIGFSALLTEFTPQSTPKSPPKAWWTRLLRGTASEFPVWNNLVKPEYQTGKGKQGSLGVLQAGMDEAWSNL